MSPRSSSEQASHLFVGYIDANVGTEPLNFARPICSYSAALGEFHIGAIEYAWAAGSIFCEACAVARVIAKANGITLADLDAGGAKLKALLTETA